MSDPYNLSGFFIPTAAVLETMKLLSEDKCVNKSKSNFKEQCEHQYVASPLYSSSIFPQKYGNPQNSRLRVKDFMFKGSNSSVINLLVRISQKKGEFASSSHGGFSFPFPPLK